MICQQPDVRIDIDQCCMHAGHGQLCAGYHITDRCAVTVLGHGEGQRQECCCLLGNLQGHVGGHHHGGRDGCGAGRVLFGEFVGSRNGAIGCHVDLDEVGESRPDCLGLGQDGLGLGLEGGIARPPHGQVTDHADQPCGQCAGQCRNTAATRGRAGRGELIEERVDALVAQGYAHRDYSWVVCWRALSRLCRPATSADTA